MADIPTRDRKTELGDPVSRYNLSLYSASMNDRLASEVYPKITKSHPELGPKLSHLPFGFYDPVCLNDKHATFLSTMSLGLQFHQMLSIGGALPKSTEAIFAPRAKELKAILEFIPFQERVYARIARAIRYVEEERHITVPELVTTTEHTDHVMRKVFEKQRQAERYFNNYGEVYDALFTLLLVSKFVGTPGDVPDNLPTDPELKTLKEASLEFVMTELDRAYK